MMTTKGNFTTKILKVNPDLPEKELIDQAARVIKNGGLVAFPTETVYGLGADLYNPVSIQSIFQVKGRPGDNPLIVHLYSVEQLSKVAKDIPDSFQLLAERFWPGPLTIILPKQDSVHPIVTAGLPTVALRIPAHPVALNLLEKADTPVAAPSANLSGRPSPTHGFHVIDDLQGKVELILDAGPTGVGVESTVLDLTGETPRILRPGGVTLEMLRETLGDRVQAPDVINSDRPLAPGMKYRHYAPEAPLYLFLGEKEAVDEEIRKRLKDLSNAGKRIAVLSFTENNVSEGKGRPDVLFYSLGSKTQLKEAARTLFGYLRLCDREEIDLIYAVAPPREGVGEAVYNRLLKAAGRNVVEI